MPRTRRKIKTLSVNEGRAKDNAEDGELAELESDPLLTATTENNVNMSEAPVDLRELEIEDETRPFGSEKPTEDAKAKTVRIDMKAIRCLNISYNREAEVVQKEMQEYLNYPLNVDDCIKQLTAHAGGT